MAGKSEVSQKINLDSKQYQDELKKAQRETRSAFGDTRKVLQDTQMAFYNFGEGVKKATGSMITEIEKVGKAFLKNLGKGAVGGAVLGGVELLKGAMHETIDTGLSFEDSLAKLASRADLSATQVKKLKDQFYELGKSGAQLESIPEAFNAIYGAVGNVEQAQSVMEPITKAAAMSNGNAAEVAEFVKDRLKGEGKEINPGNVKNLLESLVAAQRGGEFNSLADAMQGMGNVNAADQKRAGLSDREMAGILAGSTRAGADKATGIAGAQALVHMSQTGFGGGAAIAGILGVGSFMKNGKFDVGQMTKAAGNLKRSGRSDSENVSLFQSAGLSEQEATGLNAILRNITKFNDGVKKVNGDTKTLDHAFSESTDTISHRMDELKNTTVQGFDDILSPAQDVAKKLAGGDIGGALSGVPDAISGMISGIAKHPVLVAGALAGTAAGGSLLGKLGIGGGVEKGVLEGKALQKATGVIPVFVTNFTEIGGKGGGGMVAGAAEAAGTAAKGIGAVGALVAAGIGLAAGKAAEYVATGGAEQDLAGLTKGKPQSGRIPLPAEAGAPATMEHTVKVEIDSKDPAFKARPKATDNPRGARTP